MREHVRARLASRFDAIEVDEQLHDVPPHEVWAVVVDGDRAVCKFDTGPTGMAGVEGGVTAFVGEQTSVPVPEVLAVGDAWFVTAWHPDAPTPDVEHEVTVEWARVSGRGLATLHDETAPHLDQYGRITSGTTEAAIDVDGHDTWHGAAIDYVTRLEDTLSEYGHSDVASRARERLQSHPDIFEGAGEPVLCHGWWSPEHVALRDGEVECVVDLEHTIAAPGEWDVWRAILPVFDGGEPQAAFREGYESVRPLRDGFEARRNAFLLLHSLYFFESLYVQAQHDAAETEKRAAWIRKRVEEYMDEL